MTKDLAGGSSHYQVSQTDFWISSFTSKHLTGTCSRAGDAGVIDCLGMGVGAETITKKLYQVVVRK